MKKRCGWLVVLLAGCDLFDSNDDCVINAAELRASSIVESLFSPDLRIDGDDLLSFAIGVDLVPATFASR